MYIQVTQEGINQHVTAINTAVAQIEQCQQTMRRTISDPSLRTKGQYWNAALNAAQTVLSSLDQLNLQHTQLGSQINAVAMATQETDNAMARSVVV
jgi:uncharacterized protein YukE